ncbi:MAG TPA: DNA mismatch repair endonuclease MutL [Terriglobales bacterium]|nr:DNA mismatch repair endonuclease MutL [Terriglobales bacterium]
MEAEATPTRRIRVLPPEVADKIAAGEVVERPASVVKELVENSLDAGSSLVEVELEDAGIGLIAVIDDGEGMSREDAPVAFGRHATSKVRTVDDLFRITTLGFRGEALASIAAVSTTTLITRRAGDLSGTRVVVRSGAIVEVCEAGAPAGTRIEIVDLLGNTPARRKFLKSAATEVGHVSELITRTALSFPHVTFRLRHGSRTLIDYAGVSDPVDRLAQVFTRERASAMLPFHGRSAAGSIRGWLSDSHVSFPSNRHIYTYVNGRFVRDKLVSHALVAGYSTLLMHGRYPGAAVFIEVPAEDVDVNVHPAKSEVRFRRGGAVHDLITQAVKERLRAQGAPREAAAPQVPTAADALLRQMALVDPAARRPVGPLRLVAADGRAWAGSGAAPMLPQRPSRAAGIEAWQRGEPHPGVPPSHGHGSAAEAAVGWGNAAPALAPMPAAQPAAAEATQPAAGFFARLRVIGQAFEGYLVCQNGDTLFLIDQHAAHERVTFERLRTAYAAGGVARQRLLMPVVVDVGARSAPLLAEKVAELENLGFELEPFGGSSIAVRAVPALLADSDPATLIRDLADDFSEVDRSRQLSAAAEAVLARLACHSAVRVGQTLGTEQIRALLTSMDHIDFAHNCPHGRPAYITLPRSDLERLFKRT